MNHPRTMLDGRAEVLIRFDGVLSLDDEIRQIAVKYWKEEYNRRTGDLPRLAIGLPLPRTPDNEEEVQLIPYSTGVWGEGYIDYCVLVVRVVSTENNHTVIAVRSEYVHHKSPSDRLPSQRPNSWQLNRATGEVQVTLVGKETTFHLARENVEVVKFSEW